MTTHDWARTRAIWAPLPRLMLAALLMWCAAVTSGVSLWCVRTARRLSPEAL